MRAVDTNVVLRFIAEDDPAQTPVALDVFSTSVYLSLGVLMEAEWVLRSRYRWSRTRIVEALDMLVQLETVVVDEPGLVRWSLARYAAGGDLPDMLHLVAARNATMFLTFDKQIDRLSGPDAPIRIELLQ